MKIHGLERHIGGQAVTAAGDIRLVLDNGYQWLPNDSIDLILTDPPFNIARDTNFHTYSKNTINSYRFDKGKGWDSHSPEGFRELMSEWAMEFFRVLRPGGSFAVFCADEYLSDLISSLKLAGLKPRRTLTWRKPNAVPVNRKHMMMSACEYIVVGVKGSNSTYNVDVDCLETDPITQQEMVAIADKAATVAELEVRKILKSLANRPSPQEIKSLVERALIASAPEIARRSINIYSEDGKKAELCVPNYVTFNSKSGNRLHPTEKPIPLLVYLTELFSNTGDLVLDPFAGSASMGEAALLTGRQALLVEQDQEFFARGSARIIAAASHTENQLSGFLPNS
jgi:DNA modification methylase